MATKLCYSKSSSLVLVRVSAVVVEWGGVVCFLLTADRLVVFA